MPTTKYMKSLSIELRDKIPVAILGATGAVGQRFVLLLSNHPWFEVAILAASQKSAGKKYRASVKWIQAQPIPGLASDITVVDAEKDIQTICKKCKLVFSALDSSTASVVESKLAEQGVAVFSNSSAGRCVSTVPILIPQVNCDLIGVIKFQKSYDNGGFIVTNANCVVSGLTVAMKPFYDSFGISSAIVSTAQSISGAGYPGISAWDIHDNVIPYIEGEEEKIESEPLKIFGTIVLNPGPPAIKPASDMRISASVHRVSVAEGHLMTVSLKLKNRPPLWQDLFGAIKNAIKEYNGGVPDVVRSLPSCPSASLVYTEDIDRPQPRLDANAGFGMSVTIGQIRQCNVNDVKFTCVVHNLALGAAGGSILNAEYALEEGYIGAS